MQERKKEASQCLPGRLPLLLGRKRPSEWCITFICATSSWHSAGNAVLFLAVFLQTSLVTLESWWREGSQRAELLQELVSCAAPRFRARRGHRAMPARAQCCSLMPASGSNHAVRGRCGRALGQQDPAQSPQGLCWFHSQLLVTCRHLIQAGGDQVVRVETTKRAPGLWWTSWSQGAAGI